MWLLCKYGNFCNCSLNWKITKESRWLTTDYWVWKWRKRIFPLNSLNGSKGRYRIIQIRKTSWGNDCWNHQKIGANEVSVIAMSFGSTRNYCFIVWLFRYEIYFFALESQIAYREKVCQKDLTDSERDFFRKLLLMSLLHQEIFSEKLMATVLSRCRCFVGWLHTEQHNNQYWDLWINDLIFDGRQISKATFGERKTCFNQQLQGG